MDNRTHDVAKVSCLLFSRMNGHSCPHAPVTAELTVTQSDFTNLPVTLKCSPEYRRVGGENNFVSFEAVSIGLDDSITKSVLVEVTM